MKQTLFVAGVLFAVSGLPPTARAQDAEAGKAVFKAICNLCHDPVEGKSRVGPSLFNVIGRHAGSLTGFTYSDVLKNSGIVWTEAELDKWIKGPQSVVPGTRMTYSGLKDDQKRRDLIAYLKTLHH